MNKSRYIVMLFITLFIGMLVTAQEYEPTPDPFNAQTSAPAATAESESRTERTSLQVTGTVVYSNNGEAFMIRDGVLVNISDTFARQSEGEDGFINISPDGDWLLMDTTRFDAACAGWACLAVVDVELQSPEIVYVGTEPLRSDRVGAIGAGGNLLIVEGDTGPNEIDLFVTARGADGAWSAPVLLTGDSPYPYNRQPAIASDNSQLLFDCMADPYGSESSEICEVSITGEGFRLVITPENTPAGFPVDGYLHHADYAPDGSIVFEADWQGEQIWRVAPGEVAERITSTYNNDNTPCVLADGNIASLWLNRPEGDSTHEIKLMAPDGSEHTMLLTDVDVTDIGLGCGG